MKKMSICLLLLQALIPSFGQDHELIDEISDTRIRSVQLYREGWNLSYPVINLNSNDRLELHFDLLAEAPETYYYTFIHCDKDWKQSNIFVNQYIDGFPDNPVENFSPSFNTTVSYYHYKLSFPNERSVLKLSGNYIIRVYAADDPENAIITARFMVAENITKITSSVRRAQLAGYSDNSQQIDFTVDITGKNIFDPYRNIYAFVLQNGRWDNAKINLKPEFYGSNELKYNSLSEKNIFRAGNEFRYFDVRSIRYLSEYVRKIDFNNQTYNVLLANSENRDAKPYFYHKDFNGKYYVAIQEGRDHNIEADYLTVLFTLKSAYPLPESDVYIIGALTGWRKTEDNKMIYNPGNASYEGSLLLKQGWYNYEYLVSSKNPGISTSYFEGDRFETENDYIILVYYRNPGERFDRLIGTSTINTLNNIKF